MHAFRAPFRLFIIGIVGLILILAAIDILFLHKLSTPSDGFPAQLTTTGHAQQRGDIILGAALIGMGVVLVGSSFVDLLKRKPVVDVRDDGLYAQIGGKTPDVLIPWSEVATVTSTVESDPYDGATREILVVKVRDKTAVPASLAGAMWHGDELHIDAHDWNRPVTDIALAAQGAREHAMRPPPSASPSRPFEPSMMWETRVDVTTEQPVVPDASGDRSTEDEGKVDE
ncbi:MAG: hypothetical protein DWP92_04430 [Armatimonadetes bacterium]|nr:MAG: hypothetical protein DWP92_04430 [Armatimonadota bacterium]